MLAAFVVWQAFNKKEPLLPLPLFRDRNFSLSNAAITTVGFAVTCMALPLVFYFQTVRGLTPTESALMLAPMAVALRCARPVVGKLIDRVNPRNIAIAGLLLFGGLPVLVLPDADAGRRHLAGCCSRAPFSVSRCRASGDRSRPRPRATCR